MSDTTKKHVIVEREIGGRTLRFETGKVAKLANGAIVTSYGDTVVLCTAVRANPNKAIENAVLVGKVQDNVSRVTERLSHLANVDGALTVTNSLIHNATTSASLAVMTPVWYPWL